MILFDLDGTLWDSSKQVAESWTEAIRRIAPETGIVITEDFMHRAMGKVMDEIKKMMFEETETVVEQERQDAIYQACSEHEVEYVKVHGGTLYPEVERVLGILEKKYKLGIVSNCQCGYIEAFLQYTGFGRFISDTECYENTGRPKADNIALVVERNGIQPKEAVYVGDILGDYEAAGKAGVDFIHAAYGFGAVPEAVRKIDTFAGLLDVL